MLRPPQRMGGCLEEEAGIVLQTFQPVDDVGGVLLARLGRQFQMAAQERRAQRSNEFLLRLAFTTSLPATEISRKA